VSDRVFKAPNLVTWLALSVTLHGAVLWGVAGENTLSRTRLAAAPGWHSSATHFRMVSAAGASGAPASALLDTKQPELPAAAPPQREVVHTEQATVDEAIEAPAIRDIRGWVETVAVTAPPKPELQVDLEALPKQDAEADRSHEVNEPVRRELDDSASAESSDSAEAASGGGDQISYRAAVQAILARHKKYPRRARRLGVEGTCRVAFCVHADGAVGEIRLIETSRSGLLDRAARDLVAGVGRLPAPPGGFAELSFSFRYTLDEY